MNVAAQFALSQQMRPYIYPLLFDIQLGKCAICNKLTEAMEIDHIRYADDITLYDLQLLCTDCHANKTSQNNDLWASRTPHCATCTCWHVAK